MVWDGEVPLQVNDDLASISLVFITFWLNCSSPVDRGVEASVLKVCTMSPWQHKVSWVYS